MLNVLVEEVVVVLHKQREQVPEKVVPLEVAVAHFQKCFIPLRIYLHQNLLLSHQVEPAHPHYNFLEVRQEVIHHLVQVQHY
jgi:hypothetical protein